MQRSPGILPLGLILVVTPFLGSCAGAEDSDATLASDAGSGVPTFTVDPSWPLEMPNKWIMGAVTAVFVDAQDHVWVTHLPETLTPEDQHRLEGTVERVIEKGQSTADEVLDYIRELRPPDLEGA